MSHRIVDDSAAVRFPAEELRKALNHWSFHHDRFMFFELGGHNNVFTWHKSRGEVRARSWNLIATGQSWEVMTSIVEYSASCEGGTLKMAGSARTPAETYIGNARRVLDEAVTADAMNAAGLQCTITLALNPATQQARHAQDDIQQMRGIVEPVETQGHLTWTLNPLWDISHAAILFAFGGLDNRPLYNKATVYGCEYGAKPLLKRPKARRHRADMIEMEGFG